MSKNLSLKLRDEIFRETEEVLRKVKRPRNAYINEAIHFYNKMIARKALKDKLVKESNIVAADSMVVSSFEINESNVFFMFT
jgi:predicted transcriptional regulator